MGVYAADGVLQVRDLYGSLLDTIYSGITTADFSELLTNRLWDGYRNEHPGAAVEISNNFTSMAGNNAMTIFQAALRKKDIRATIDHEIGPGNTATIIDPEFERAIDTLLAGEFESLKIALEQSPELLSQRSAFRHGATLLHYAGSNGVELWRQVVPENLPEIVMWLIDRGMDPATKMAVYGGNHDVRSLAASSAHPADAQIRDALLSALA